MLTNTMSCYEEILVLLMSQLILSKSNVCCLPALQSSKTLKSFMRKAGLTYYYFDFKDSKKQDWCGLISSLLLQRIASTRSDAFSNVLNRLYKGLTTAQ